MHLIGEELRMGIINKDMNIVKKVRLSFRVTTLSDIADVSGSHIKKEWYGKGEKR